MQYKYLYKPIISFLTKHPYSKYCAGTAVIAKSICSPRRYRALMLVLHMHSVVLSLLYGENE
jgi:hypothetical protein